ncbi:MAG: hypothetical protein D3919_10250 [Candidatus Electrothrix sp. AW5]|jgi:c(7)-type cytochrome triheme protein|nr:hypothetical protein [Candidatus Electrothrix gigas]MCI5196591.1 hypothetical protein [Candidatus Electrothrix gigas]
MLEEIRMKVNKITVTLLGTLGIFVIIAGLNNGTNGTNGTQEAIANEKPPEQADVFPEYSIGLFSHTAHVTDAGLQCTACHNKIFQMSASTVKINGDFNKISFGEGKYCGACHNGTKSFAINDKANCSRCHKNDTNPPDTILLEKPLKTVRFNHALHSKELGLACNECHMRLFAMKTGSTGEQDDFTMEAMYKGKYCGTCHNGTLAFHLKTNCTKCHLDTPEYKRAISESGD